MIYVLNNMARKVTCPNVNHDSYKNLLKRVEDENIAHNIWDKTHGNISDDGLPYASEFIKLDEEARSILLRGLSTEEASVAMQNIQNEESRVAKNSPIEYIPKKNRDFTYTVKTSDGKVLSLREKTAALDSITYEVSQALLHQKSAKVLDIMSSAKNTITTLKNAVEKDISKLAGKNQLTQNDEALLRALKTANRSYDKILDDGAWNQLQDNAINLLELNGIRFRSRNKRKLKQLLSLDDEFLNSIVTEDATTQDATDSDLVEKSFDVDDSLGKDPKEYSSVQVKAMMMGIKDFGSNNLGVTTLYDQSRVYKEVLMALTANNDFSEKGMMNTLLEESKKHPGDDATEEEKKIEGKEKKLNFFAVIYNILKDSKNQQLRIQFQNAMNKQRNQPVVILINSKDPAASRVAKANNSRIESVVIKQWYSDMSNALDLLYESKFAGNLFGYVDHIKGIGEEFKSLKTILEENRSLPNEDKNNLIKGYASRMLEDLGIKLSDNSFSALLSGDAKTLYNRRNSYNLASKGFSTSYLKSGVFGSIADILSKFDIKKLNADEITSSAISDKLVNDLNQTGLRFLANVEGKASNRFFANNFIGIGGKPRYNYKQPSPNFNLIRNLQTNTALRDVLASAVGLRKLSLFSNKYFGGRIGDYGVIEAANEEFSNGFLYDENYAMKEYGTNDGAERSDLSDVDLHVNAMYLFQEGGSFMSILDTTKSDKKESPIFKVPRVELNAIAEEGGKVELTDLISFVNGNMLISKFGKRQIMDSELMSNAMTIVSAELDRMIYVLTHKDGDVVKEMKKQLGANYEYNSQFFYSASFLNGLIKRNIDGSIYTDKGIGDLDINKKHIETKFKEALYNHFISQISSDLNSWEKLGLLKTSGSKYYTSLIKYEWGKSKGYAPFMKKQTVSNEYASEDVFDDEQIDDEFVTAPNQVSSHKNNIYNDEMLRVLSLLSLESSMNSFSIMGGFGLVMSGDPAQSSQSLQKMIKSESDDNKANGIKDPSNAIAINSAMEKFMNEYQKRLSSDISPAVDSVGEYTITLNDGSVVSSKPTYKVAYVDDSRTDGKDYLTSLPQNLQNQVDKYTGKGTDGLEYVSFYNKLDALYRTGVIRDRDFVELRRQYAEDGTVNKKYSKHFVIGAGKPRQVSIVVKEIGGENIAVKTFIKSAELPLTQEFARSVNQDLVNLVEAMEMGYDEDPSKDQHIGRIPHKSSGKQGGITPVSIYGKDSAFTIKNAKDLRAALDQSSGELPWTGFGYQQETPTHLGEGLQTNVVQADKSILGGLYEEEFTHHGDKISGEQLDLRKHGINAELSKIAKQSVDESLKTDGEFDIDKIVKKSIKVDSGISNNEANSALAVDKYGLPLFWSYSRKSLEEFLFSQYTDAIKLQRSGRANPQFPLTGGGKVTIKTEIDPRNGVIMLNGRDSSEQLKYTRIKPKGNGGEEVQVAEIIVPFDFISMGNSVDMNSIDLNNIDPSLLNIIGMRLPNQLHQSQVLFKIVGFTPKGMGTMVIVPQEIVVQTGSDFDIDKLYQYWRNAFLTKDNKLVSIPKNVTQYDENGHVSINKDAVNSFIENNFEEGNRPSVEDVFRQAIENDYVDLFESVLSNPNVVRMSLEALDADDLKDTGKKYKILQPKASWYSWQRQIGEYKSQQSAKGGIDIYAKAMSSIILAYKKDMVFKDLSVSKISLNGNSSPLILRYINPYGKSIINGEDRTALRNIVILLSESIDNAKNGNLIPNGLNGFTFNIAESLMLLSDSNNNSLPLIYVPAILNQEIVKMVSGLIDNSKGVVRTSGKTLNLKTATKIAFADLLRQLDVTAVQVATETKKLSNKVYNEQELYGIYNTGQKIMSGQEVSVTEKVLWVSQQKDIMENIFTPLSKIANKLFDLNNQTGFDKGFKSSSAENNLLLSSILSSGNDGSIINSDKFTQSPNGELNTTGNNLVLAEDIIFDVDKILGYNGSILMTAIDKITLFNGLNKKTKPQMISSVVDGYKSYVFSKVISESFCIHGTVEEIGASISKKIRELQSSTSSKYKNNRFLTSISINKTNKIISFNGDLKNNADLEKAMDGFYTLSKDTDDDVRQLTTSIIMYEFLTSGNKTKSSFTKVIPIDALESIGFYSKLAEKIRELRDGSHVDEFINLFYRNNPQYIISFNTLDSRYSKFAGVGSGNNYHKGLDRNFVRIGQDFKLKEIPLFLKSSKGSPNANIYIFDSPISSGNNKLALYKKYDYSILKGSASYFESSMNRVGKKVFDSGYFTDYKPDAISTGYFVGGMANINSLSNDFNTEKIFFLRMLKEQTDVRSLLPVVEQIDTTYSKWIVELLKQLPDNIQDISVKYSDEPSVNNSIAEFNIVDGKSHITIYNGLFEQEIDRTGSISFAKETILHEIQHSMMAESYLLGKNGDPRFKQIADNVDMIYDDAMDAISNEPIVSSVDGTNFIIDDEPLTYGQFIKDGRLDSEAINSIFEDDKDMQDDLRKSLYMLNSQMDFISELSSRKYIQDLMNSVYLSDNTYEKVGVEKSKSLLETLFSKFASFFDSIVSFFNGSFVNQQSVLEAAMIQNMMLTNELMNTKTKKPLKNIIRSTNQKYAPNEIIDPDSQQITGTVRDFLGKSTREERSAFRHALNNNIFKTKC
jgi:hypothetical protein